MTAVLVTPQYENRPLSTQRGERVRVRGVHFHGKKSGKSRIVIASEAKQSHKYPDITEIATALRASQ
jgi:hypothetical protein